MSKVIITRAIIREIQMPINQSWVNEPHIIEFQLSGDITFEDFSQIGQDGLSLVTENSLYVLIDFSDVVTLPKNLINTILRTNTFIDFINHNNTMYFAIVRPNQATRFMIDTVFRDIQFAIVDSHQDGIDTLQQQVDNID